MTSPSSEKRSKFNWKWLDKLGTGIKDHWLIIFVGIICTCCYSVARVVRFIDDKQLEVTKTSQESKLALQKVENESTLVAQKVASEAKYAGVVESWTQKRANSKARWRR
jgi:hypothetical protein